MIKIGAIEKILGSSCFAHTSFVVIFLTLSVVSIVVEATPDHDAIIWHGIWHYYSSSLLETTIPWWNPYSHTGTPFYFEFQTLGLTSISAFFFIGVQYVFDTSSVTSYVNHYLFCYWVFIIGTYHTISKLTRNSAIGFGFSLILLFAVFPVFARQNGALNSVFLLPLITYFLISVLYVGEKNRRGVQILLLSGLSGISFLFYVPSATVLHVLLFFLVFVWIERKNLVKQLITYCYSGNGLIWIGLSILVFFMIISPVLYMYYEVNYGTELFPANRVSQSLGTPKVFASDWQYSHYSTREIFTNYSLTLLNIVGLVSSFNNVLKGVIAQEVSEIFLYVSLVPLMCLSLYRVRLDGNLGLYFVVGIAVLVLLTVSFGGKVTSPLSITQSVLSRTIPTLSTYRVYQNFGPLLLFYILVLGSLVFTRLKGKWILSVLVVMPVFNYVVLLIVPAYRHPHFSKMSLEGILFYFAVVAVGIITLFVLQRGQKLSVDHVKGICIAIMVGELAYVSLTYYETRTLPHLAYKYMLSQHGITYWKSEDEFIHTRVPMVSGDYFSPEMFRNVKAAYPGKIRIQDSKNEVSTVSYRFRQIFSTTYYYDYLANVDVAKQIPYSSIGYSLMEFYPDASVRWLPDKYSVVKAINNEQGAARKYLYLEESTIERGHRDRLEVPDVALKVSVDPLLVTNLETLGVDRESVDLPENIEIVDHSVNHLVVDLYAPSSGQLYYGDGYSHHWRVFVNNEEQSVYKANINSKSVKVEKGQNRVEFIYDPKMYKVLFISSIFTQCFFVLLLLYYLVATVRKSDVVFLE